MKGWATQLEKAIELLKRGAVVAFPTDTVYGLGAHSLLAEAVVKIYDVKERPRDKPLQLLLAEVGDIAQVAEEVPGLVWKLAERFWPGSLTLVVRCSPLVLPQVTGGGETVAVRVPAHPIPRELARKLGAPLAATSANLSGQPSPVTAEGVRRQLGGRIRIIVDGGRCPVGVESTVVEVAGDGPHLLREGAIPPPPPGRGDRTFGHLTFL